MCPKELRFRFTEIQDAPYLKRWLMDSEILRWFPMHDVREIEDAVRIWVGYSRIQAALTALWDEEPCGMANLYISPFRKLAHTCLFSIIVSKQHRNKGIGSRLLEEVKKIAKENFKIETLHLEVYEGNPAKRLYERMGFKEFGFQKHFIKEQSEYLGKYFMQCVL